MAAVEKPEELEVDVVAAVAVLLDVAPVVIVVEEDNAAVVVDMPLDVTIPDSEVMALSVDPVEVVVAEEFADPKAEVISMPPVERIASTS